MSSQAKPLEAELEHVIQDPPFEEWVIRRMSGFGEGMAAEREVRDPWEGGEAFEGFQNGTLSGFAYDIRTG